LSICPIESKAIVDEDDGQTAGSYGRIIAVVYCNRRNINAEMISNKYVTIDQSFCNVSEFANEDWSWKFC
jgi:endonuclease YncB( thermonuclease family)